MSKKDFLKNSKGQWWPTKYQWRQFFKVLSKKEKIALAFFSLIFLVSLVWFLLSFYQQKTSQSPKKGGEYIEGIVGTPRFLNPILSQTSDTDRDISGLIFSGLMKNRDGHLLGDLAHDYAIGEEGKIYDFFLKEDVFWHDGQKFGADDVIFTIETIQNQEYRSPLRANWQGVGVEKIDDFTVRFLLKNPYAPFLNNLTTGIIAKHIWENVSPAKFSLSELNLKPVGTGPYKVSRLIKKGDKIESLELSSNKKYYFGVPFIESIKLVFFENQQEALSALNGGKINGLALNSILDLERINPGLSLDKYSFPLPRYFALFLNDQKNKALSEKLVRQALAHAIDKKSIVEQVLGEDAILVDSAIPPFLFGHNGNIDIYDFSPEHARNFLLSAGWQDSDGDGVVEKKDQTLEIIISLPEWPELVQIASLIQKYWQDIEVKVTLDIREAKKVQKEVIKTRDYQILLFGEALGIEPDPFAFWHSSQRNDPGLNLALYQNKKVDLLLEEARQDINPESRSEKLKQLQEIIAQDLPAIFLYSPDFLYVIDKKVKNISGQLINVPSERFNNIEEWYIRIKRSWSWK